MCFKSNCNDPLLLGGGGGGEFDYNSRKFNLIHSFFYPVLLLLAYAGVM